MINTNLENIKEYFEPLKDNPDHSFVKTAIELERKASIENHPFFEKAKKNKAAMILWTCQEAIITNPFSQILFRLISNINNVHIRSILIPVVYGEHSSVKKGRAEKSHPWLIWRLCESLKINAADIKPTTAIIDFINTLDKAAENPMYGLGVLGIGNELMLIAEYTAVKSCFDVTFPEADYKEFLQANIGEDEIHSQLIGKAAAALGAFGHDPNDFLDGAKDGITSRIKYYDELLQLIK